MSAIRAHKPSLAREIWKYRHLYLLMAPFLLVFTVFIISPIVVSIVLSLTDMRIDEAVNGRVLGAGIRVYNGLNSVYVHTNDTSPLAV